MGCNQSKIENEETVSRCKERKLFMKEAVSSRNAFAAAHSSYSISLKNTGAALNDFAQAEIPPHLTSFSSEPILIQPPTSSSAPPSLLPPLSSVFPPPPPNPSDFQPLQRAVSMPEMKIQKPELKPLEEPIIEEDEMESEANERLVRKRSTTSSNRATSVQGNHHQQQQHHHETWDYFFPSIDSIPGPSLTEPTVMEEEVNKEQMQRKSVSGEGGATTDGGGGEGGEGGGSSGSGEEGG
ncbi:hypothetical protein OIU77_027724 [Salix suchowensis]|uniref:DUF630 domain-containing protein n=1 Tax=Salix suchowensis TaxID=1278906 RepID=A0ABQ9BQM0_9ROSI|nr:hypothetical protein OIU77_027724 [Salix suchowensis]